MLSVPKDHHLNCVNFFDFLFFEEVISFMKTKYIVSGYIIKFVLTMYEVFRYIIKFVLRILDRQYGTFRSLSC